MPWGEQSEMESRERFIVELLREELSFSELCEDFGVSRKTGYKWRGRFEREGWGGLARRHSRPLSFRDETSVEVLCEVIKVRQWKNSWGGRKIRQYLSNQGMKDLPHPRTIDRILKRSGFVENRGKVKQAKREASRVIAPKECNDVWTVDVKGWWRTKDQRVCNPLTLRDEFSRFILGIEALEQVRLEPVQEVFIEAFEKYGLPLYVRSDNGPPFGAARSLCGLTRLSVWLIKLGVMPNLIAPASPHQNGAHERMHRDIKRELQNEPARNCREEQKRFELWRHEFNHLRPHEALKGDVSAKHFRASRRKYPSRLEEHVYPVGFAYRRVSTSGEFFWNNKPVSFSKALAGETIGIEKIKDSNYKVWFRDICLAVTDRYMKVIRPLPVVARQKTA